MSKDVALVLSSGGARGIAHIGVIEELLSQAYNIKSIAGTSMGALIGGIYAAGELDTFSKWLYKLDKIDVFNMIDLTIGSGIMKGDRIIREIKKLIPDKNIEDLSIPFTAIATDIINEKEVVISKGSLFDAIRASISIPLVFVPHIIDNKRLIDGGVINPIPLNRVVKEEGDLLIAVNVNSRIPYIPPPEINKEENSSLKMPKQLLALQKRMNSFIPNNKKDHLGYFNLVNRSTSLMLNQISEMTIAHNKPDILINISRDSFGTYDFYKAKEIATTGRIRTRETLEKK